MNKEELTCLMGKYLNGYKIVKIENDPFIKGQINLFTDEWEYEAFNDRALVKFCVRNDSNTSRVYKELVDKEKYKLKKALFNIKQICDKWFYGNENFCINSNEAILQIIYEAIGDEKDEKDIKK